MSATLNDRAMRAFLKARIALVLAKDAASVFFCVLAFRLVPVVTESVPTAATDGHHILLNPSWWLKLTDAERLGVLIHEVMHCAQGHFTRRGGIDPELWNEGADFAINDVIAEAGKSLPSGCLLPTKYGLDRFLCAEAYVALLRQNPDLLKRLRSGGFPGDRGGCGAVADAGAFGKGATGVGQGAGSANADAMAAEWRVLVSQAARTARGRGALPGGLDRFVTDVLAPKVDYRAVLTDFLTAVCVKSDYSWARLSRRSTRDYSFPGLRGEDIGLIAVTVDQSGSVTDDEQKQIGGEIEGILSAFENVRLRVFFHDVAVHKVVDWTPQQGRFPFSVGGRGGTSHIPVFEAIAAMDEAPVAVICLTDLDSVFPDSPPPCPVLWITTGTEKAPWGTVVPLRTGHAA